MGYNIEGYKYKFKEIMLEFGEVIGDSYIILDNEYYEDGDCFCNLSNMIDKIFNTGGSSDVLLKQRESVLSYKELYDAYDNLGLEEPEDEEEW